MNCPRHRYHDLMKCWFFIVLILPVLISAQTEHNFHWPMDPPFVITGNYGELRPNHFHAGIDFSTGGKTGLPIYSIEEGYVSRIRASAVGYGRSLYITHPGGKVSVYAHLSSFNLNIEKAIKAQQNKYKTFEIDYYPPKDSLPVVRGEVVALSGNSGGSTGPHLHFEVRDERTEIPLNPLVIFKYDDQVAPVVTMLGIYDLADTLHPRLIRTVALRNGSSDAGTLVMPSGIIGLAFAGYDQTRANGNKNNIYNVSIFQNDRLLYQHRLDQIAFSESRYVNEFADVWNGVRLQKGFLPTLYPRGPYHHVISKGRIFLTQNTVHSLKMDFEDERGNRRTITMKVRSSAPPAYSSRPVTEKLFDCSSGHTITRRNSRWHLPANTFYRATALSVDDQLEANGRIILAPEKLNFNQSTALAVKVPERFYQYGKKVVLRSANSTIAGMTRNDSLVFPVKETGQYFLALDTIPPRLSVHPYCEKHKEPWKLSSFSFLIDDKLSGIGKYDLFINNIWVLAEFDAKNRLLTYYFDEDSPFGLLQFRLEVEDKVGNRETLFYLLKK